MRWELEKLNSHEVFAYAKCQELIDKATELRRKTLLSQKQVAEQLGLNSHGTVTQMEQGRGTPRLETFLRILSVYGYTLKIVPKDKSK